MAGSIECTHLVHCVLRAYRSSGCDDVGCWRQSQAPDRTGDSILRQRGRKVGIQGFPMLPSQSLLGIPSLPQPGCHAGFHSLSPSPQGKPEGHRQSPIFLPKGHRGRKKLVKGLSKISFYDIVPDKKCYIAI